MWPKTLQPNDSYSSLTYPRLGTLARNIVDTNAPRTHCVRQIMSPPSWQVSKLTKSRTCSRLIHNKVSSNFETRIFRCSTWSRLVVASSSIRAGCRRVPIDLDKLSLFKTTCSDHSQRGDSSHKTFGSRSNSMKRKNASCTAKELQSSSVSERVSCFPLLHPIPCLL